MGRPWLMARIRLSLSAGMAWPVPVWVTSASTPGPR